MAKIDNMLPVTIKEEEDLDGAIKSGEYDGLLFIHWPKLNLCPSKCSHVGPIVSSYLKSDCNLSGDVAIAPFPALGKGARLVLSGTGKIDPDYDDVRSLKDAVHKGVKRALKANVKKLLVQLQSHPDFENAELVTLLAVLEAVHVPIQVREYKKPMPSFDHVGFFSNDGDKAATNKIVTLAKALESGRRLAREISEGDPERMSPMKVQEYVEAAFQGSSIKVSVISDEEVFKKEYPLFEAVNRAATHVDRHKGRIMYLEYTPKSPITETLYLVGKGVTYDTGGADIKAGGCMAGMSRDKCGAASVAGFMQVVEALQPAGTKVVGAMSMVRNSVGSNCYVADELIKARSGKLIRIGNTDAEGRMVMADVLCKLREDAMDAVNPHLFTIATLTGHAHLAVGEGYSIGMDNGPARRAGTSARLQEFGVSIAEPFEISVIRREDLVAHKPTIDGDDVMQANNNPSSRNQRGHQGPFGFMVMASGMDGHGSGDPKPLKYSHLDIAASAGTIPNPATGAPVLALANTFLLNKK